MIDQFNEQFGVPGAITVAAGNCGLPLVHLRHASDATAAIYLHGAHVASWTVGGAELFFLSSASNFLPDKPIRGGIPVIFPQFGGLGPLPMHGIARTSDWMLAAAQVREDGAVAAAFHLIDSPVTRAVWPCPFELSLWVVLEARTLTVTLQARNTGTAAFDFRAALHTYFRVTDIRRAAVLGLQGVTLVDDLRDGLREAETRDAIRFDRETDRVYVQAPDTVRIIDEAAGRTFHIEKTGMPDYVVWNPWIAKAQRMPDFDDDEWPYMVCVETGIVERAQTLAPGTEWLGGTTFRCE